MTTPPLTIVSAAIRPVLVNGIPTVEPVATAGHRPWGVLDVEPMAYGFRLWHAPLEALGDAQVSSDETLGGLKITSHASWGMDHVDVSLKRDGIAIGLALACKPYANVWVHLEGWPA